MKRLLLLALLASLPVYSDTANFDWTGLDREIISLEAPLLIVKAPKGFIGCGYINVNACLDEACATVNEVNTHDEMLTATISAASKDAEKLGIKVGMSGAEAIELLR
jgi:uncharacterized protein YunC (DUF1805 family)